MVRAVSIAMLLASAGLLGCAGDELVARTELMLVADTDIEELNQIEFEVSQGERRRTSNRIAIESSDAPFTMAVLREEGPLGPVTARAIGYRNNLALVERSAVVSFVPGKTLTVVLHLVQSCINDQCDQGQTCTERGCQAADAGALTPWNGTAPQLGDDVDAGILGADAGSDAASADGGGTDAAANDASDAVWMQCGPAEVDVNSDVNHCGRCDRVCRGMTGPSSSNLEPACIDGGCGVACRTLWGDCDGDGNNGCENWLAYDAENCGACGLTCAAAEYCWLGECRIRQD